MRLLFCGLLLQLLLHYFQVELVHLDSDFLLSELPLDFRLSFIVHEIEANVQVACEV